MREWKVPTSTTQKKTYENIFIYNDSIIYIFFPFVHSTLFNFVNYKRERKNAPRGQK